MYPLEDAEELVQQFLNCTLMKWDWTHEAHMVVGLYMVTHFGAEALDQMRIALKKYNLSTGVENTDTSGYHETLTYFWLERIRTECTDHDGSLCWDQRTLDYLLINRALTNRNVWLEIYPEAVIKSLEARRSVVLPAAI
jgi:hypothetical protein